MIIDDYDLVSTSSGNPLSGLTEMLPFARDVGVRFIIARSSAGAGRTGYEAFSSVPGDADKSRGRRSLDTDRLAAVSDGVFSIAATLLVLELAVLHRAHHWNRYFTPGPATWAT
ncbi:TMEM175 family protein [Streptomyces sp. NBC_01314]|nr:TMEM175 family protein [Streptomyces sp. NBC_01314]